MCNGPNSGPGSLRLVAKFGGAFTKTPTVSTDLRLTPANKAADLPQAVEEVGGGESESRGSDPHPAAAATPLPLSL